MKTNWDNNHLQFARLLAEIASVGLSKKQLKALAETTDLKPSDLAQLFDRAMLEWERASPGHHSVRKYTPARELAYYSKGEPCRTSKSSTSTPPARSTGS